MSLSKIASLLQFGAYLLMYWVKYFAWWEQSLVSIELSELWSNITISGCNPWVTPRRDAVPLLESVSLIGKQYGLLNWFENAPALRSVPLSSFRCPWNQITLLRLSECPMINTSLYKTLIQASNLQELDLGICVLPGRVQPSMEIEPHQMVELPRLKKLSVQLFFPENIASILSMISAVSLEELIVTDNSINNNQEIIDCVISLMNKSMATERLTVTLGDKKSITVALTRILFEISGVDAALQFEKHECAVLFLMEFANRTRHLTLPGGSRIYNPFRIRSLGYRETIEELIQTLKDPGLFIEKVFVLNEYPQQYPQRWVKLSFQRFLILSNLWS
ncbi:hypothetical protein BDQ12DRAFT_669603 [Crucibulum laeve]|uniref:Uncharacterized protein n=1 Tax=Crucibulum laeve TaxID=68775 RepID=A0A5C3LNI0_9AGAR|nr:hypothetical protein BDQ12DRAFT_669603 [Crucibulum laeve]